MKRKENKDIQLEFQIIEEEKIKCLLTSSKYKNHIMKLPNQQNDYLLLTLLFEMNEIIIGNETTNSIHFMKDIINNPDEYKEYQIQYKEKHYSLFAEVLFALIIYQFKRILEKEWIIDCVKLDTQCISNTKSIERLYISLEALQLPIKTKEYQINDTHLQLQYQQQGELLNEIIELFEEYQKGKYLLERAESLQSNNQKKQLLTVDSSLLFTRKTIYQIGLQFTCKEKTAMKLYSLDNYCIFLSSKYCLSLEDHINLAFVCKRLQFNMDKFHYNPISLTDKTRKYFPNIETLHLYEPTDKPFSSENTGRIIQIILSPSCLPPNHLHQLEEWIGLKYKEILFDSNKDNWNKHSSIFNKRISGKKQIVFLIETEDGEKFGYYLNTEIGTIERERKNWSKTDNKSFEFNLQSNGRLQQPMKFEIKDLEEGGYELFEKSTRCGNLITFGDILLHKEDKKNESYCYQAEDKFDYHGIEKALCGHQPNKYGEMYFTPKRILVIQMK